VGWVAKLGFIFSLCLAPGFFKPQIKQIKMSFIPNIKDYQTPPYFCDFMVSKAPVCKNYLEPSPGAGNLVAAIKRAHPNANITVPKNDFFKMQAREILDCCVIMNPPFTPMALGYQFLITAFSYSLDIVAIMPMFLITNSAARQEQLFKIGLSELVVLPRCIFRGTRIQIGLFIFSPTGHKPPILSYYKRSE
jgi:hypothetical protein